MSVKRFFGVCLMAIAMAAHAQTTKTDAAKPRVKGQQSKAIQQPQPTAEPPASPASPPTPPAPPPATGPTGMGSVKLGMTKEALLALPADEPVRVASELIPVVEKNEPEPGTERLEGKIVVPFSSEPVKGTLTFKEGVLIGISMTTEGDDSLLERMAKQIDERYGPGKVKDTRKDEQCIYRNGNSFTLKSGLLVTSWETPAEAGKVAATRFTELDFNMCPSNLRYGSTGGMKLKTLSIRLGDKEVAAPKKSIF